MHRISHFLLLLTLSLACSPAAAQTELLWHWEDGFSQSDKRKLTRWIEDTVGAVEAYVGPFPFDVHIHFNRAFSFQPVPWANTIRSSRQGVNFHVNPWYSADAFRADWTSYHELSHLLLPYLGQGNAWFAEGFASFLQYRLMHTAGVLSRQEMEDRYRERLDNAARRFNKPDLTFVEAAPLLMAEGQYPTMYWGGAVYFFRVDAALAREGASLAQVIRKYVDCCRVDRLRRIDDLTAVLDRIAGVAVFGKELSRFRQQLGFPLE